MKPDDRVFARLLKIAKDKAMKLTGNDFDADEVSQSAVVKAMKYFNSRESSRLIPGVLNPESSIKEIAEAKNIYELIRLEKTVLKSRADGNEELSDCWYVIQDNGEKRPLARWMVNITKTRFYDSLKSHKKMENLEKDVESGHHLVIIKSHDNQMYFDALELVYLGLMDCFSQYIRPQLDKSREKGEFLSRWFLLEFLGEGPKKTALILADECGYKTSNVHKSCRDFVEKVFACVRGKDIDIEVKDYQNIEVSDNHTAVVFEDMVGDKA